MRFLVLGTGALGGYFGANLIQGGADVTFMVRQRRAEQIRTNGLVIQEGEAEIRLTPNLLQPNDAYQTFDVILLACEAYDLQAAMQAISRAIGAKSAILPVLNGIRHIDELVGTFGTRHVLGGLTPEHGLLTPNGNIVRSPLSAVYGMTTFGELDGTVSDRCEALDQVMESAGMRFAISRSIIHDMWGKLPMFAVVTAIATLCRSRAGGNRVRASQRGFRIRHHRRMLPHCGGRGLSGSRQSA